MEQSDKSGDTYQVIADWHATCIKCIASTHGNLHNCM